MRQLRRIFVYAMACAVLMAPGVLEAATRPAAAPPIVQRYKKKQLTTSDVARLAQWDVLILDIDAEFYSRDRIEEIREANPSIVILAEVSAARISKNAANARQGTALWHIGQALAQQPEWMLRKANGRKARVNAATNVMNLSARSPEVVPEGGTDTQQFRDFYVDFLTNAVVTDDLWDGIAFRDMRGGVSGVHRRVDLDQDGNAETAAVMNRAWRNGVSSVVRQIRQAARQNDRNNFVVVGMGKGSDQYAEQLNGQGILGFPDTRFGAWTRTMRTYMEMVEATDREVFTFVEMTRPSASGRRNYRAFRYAFTSTMLSDGYAAYSQRSRKTQWYFDEYSVDFGTPSSDAFNVLRSDDPQTMRRGVWRRDFTNAIVLVNSTNQEQRIVLEDGFDRIHGDQDHDTNDGEPVGAVVIPAHDGIVLQRRLNIVQDTTVYNGGVSKVFKGDGEHARNSFFPFDTGIESGAEMHTIARTGHTIIADSNAVRIFNERNEQIAEFFPYGRDYNGGIHIDVGQLYDTSQRYIVTGNATGTPQVRIYDTSGNLRHSGCQPYQDMPAASGLYVGIGDLENDGHQEIVVAAASGIGPHVRVLNNVCDTINTGWYAFDSSLPFGVSIGVGNVDNGLEDEVIVAPASEAAPHIRVFTGTGDLINPGFYAYSTSHRGGVLLSTADIDADGIDEIITSTTSFFDL